MGRYRPPVKPGSQYITPEGKKRLRDELDYLWKTLRPEVTRAVTAAAAEGDRSENAEYIYRKKQLREIDSRVRFLRKRLDGMIVVDRKPNDLDTIYFGAWVALEDDQGVEKKCVLLARMSLTPNCHISVWILPWAKPCSAKNSMKNSPLNCPTVRLIT